MEELLRITLHEKLFEIVSKRLGWSYDDEKESCVDKYGIEIGWEDFDSLVMDRPVYDTEGNAYRQINIWGDGTLEFQDDNGDSFCWVEFSKGFMEDIFENIKLMED